jgi:TM2 domain-containing membrane protein YozV
MSSCALHPQAPIAAYCRTCGTALCEACKRSVKGVIFCENCLAERLQAPEFREPAPAGPRAVAVTPVRTSPSPGLAAVLAILFPFGIGQVYCGLYAKGLAHLLVFTFLVWGASHAMFGMEVVFGLGIAFFYVYQIIDAYKSAQAIQMGRPAPDPFQLGSLFSGSSQQTMGAQPTQPPGPNLPVGAIVLIVLGTLFLLSNMGIFHFHWIGRFWPGVLVVLGIWLLMRRRAEVASAPTPSAPPQAPSEEVRRD